MKGKRRKGLEEKVRAVLRHLVDDKKLSSHAAKPVEKAVNTPNHLFSIETLHEFVHLIDHNPVAGDLRKQWSNFEPFMKALWPEA